MNDADRRRYLLGALDDERSAAVEREYLGDEAAMERMRVVEDELIDAYVAGELDPAETAAFEERLAIVPDWPARVAFARALHEAAARPERRPEPAESFWVRLGRWLFPGAGAPRWVGAVALAGALVVGVVLTLPGGGATIGIDLRPDNLRGPGEVARLSLPDGADRVTIRLELELPDEFSSYRLEVRRGAEAVWTSDGLTAGTSAVITVSIPAERLAPGGHELALAGERDGALEPVAFYSLYVLAPP